MLVDKSEGGCSPPLLKNNFPYAVNGLHLVIVRHGVSRREDYR